VNVDYRQVNDEYVFCCCSDLTVLCILVTMQQAKELQEQLTELRQTSQALVAENLRYALRFGLHF
jgi:hypothetical protein